jgi:hypothetical protein
MLPLFAEMGTADWLAIAGTVGAGIATGGATLAKAIRFAFTKYAEIRREERKHEQNIAQKFTESAEKIQKDAADDNRKAFAALIEIQRTATETVAGVSAAVAKLDAGIAELRADLADRAPRRRRPRPAAGPSENGDDRGDGPVGADTDRHQQ